MSPSNMPENYEAIANTYSLVLLFSRAKVTYRFKGVLNSWSYQHLIIEVLSCKLLIKKKENEIS